MSRIEDIDLESYSIEELNTLLRQVREEIAQREQAGRQDVLIEMEKLANSIGMSIEDILGPGTAGTKQPRGHRVRFRNPANPEQTWNGRGKRPRWLQEALEQGASLDDFLA